MVGLVHYFGFYSRLHNNTARGLFSCLFVKYFRLCAQPRTFFNQIIKLFASAQDTLNSLVERDFKLVHFFLNLQNTVYLLRVLVPGGVVL